MKYAIPYLLIALWISIVSFRLPEEKEFLGQKVPELMLLDAHGKNISLYSLLGEKPLIILPVYTKCPSICGVISNGAQVAIRQSGKLGKDFNVISFSFDSTDTSLDLEN